MPPFVHFFIVITLFNAVFLRWNYRDHPLLFSLFDDGVAVIATISQQIIRRHAVDQATGLCAIRSCTLRDNDSDRHTMRIHGQMYFGVKPPFVRLIS